MIAPHEELIKICQLASQPCSQLREARLTIITTVGLQLDQLPSNTKAMTATFEALSNLQSVYICFSNIGKCSEEGQASARAFWSWAGQQQRAKLHLANLPPSGLAPCMLQTNMSSLDCQLEALSQSGQPVMSLGSLKTVTFRLAYREGPAPSLVQKTLLSALNAMSNLEVMAMVFERSFDPMVGDYVIQAGRQLSPESGCRSSLRVIRVVIKSGPFGNLSRRWPFPHYPLECLIPLTFLIHQFSALHQFIASCPGFTHSPFGQLHSDIEQENRAAEQASEFVQDLYDQSPNITGISLMEPALQTQIVFQLPSQLPRKQQVTTDKASHMLHVETFKRLREDNMHWHWRHRVEEYEPHHKFVM